MKSNSSRQGNYEISSSKRGLQEGYGRVTFIIKDEIAYKLKCIASIDDIFLKDIVNEVFGKFITEWEKKNGKAGKLKKK